MLHYQELSAKVLTALFSVHKGVGPGLLESAYSGALAIELEYLAIPFTKEQPFHLYYRKHLAGNYIADFVVDNSIILEIKSVSTLTSVMEAQLLNYLKISGLKVGYLVNFRGSRLQFKRLVN